MSTLFAIFGVRLITCKHCIQGPEATEEAFNRYTDRLGISFVSSGVIARVIHMVLADFSCGLYPDCK